MYLRGGSGSGERKGEEEGGKEKEEKRYRTIVILLWITSHSIAYPEI